MDITLRNLYGKAVRIITTHPDKVHQQFVIAAARSYQIISSNSTSEKIYITAYDAATFFPLTLNGENSQNVFPSVKRVTHVFYIPSGESLLLNLFTLHRERKLAKIHTYGHYNYIPKAFCQGNFTRTIYQSHERFRNYMCKASMRSNDLEILDWKSFQSKSCAIS